MKLLSRSVCLWILSLSLFLIASCSDIIEARDANSFAIQLPVNGRSILGSDNVDHYVIEFYKAGTVQPIVTKTGIPGSMIESGPLEPGEYCIKGYAYLVTDNNENQIFAEGSTTAVAEAGITTQVELPLNIYPDFAETEKIVEFSDYEYADSFTVKEAVEGQTPEAVEVEISLKTLIPYDTASAYWFYTTSEANSDGSYPDDSIFEQLLNEIEASVMEGSVDWSDVCYLSSDLMQVSSENELTKGMNSLQLSASVKYPASHITTCCIVCTKEESLLKLWRSEIIEITGTAIKNADSNPPSEERYSQWSELKKAVEAYTGKEPKVFSIFGSCDADSKITVNGNVVIYPVADVVIGRKTGDNPFINDALFQVEPGASLTLGGNENHKLELEGRSGEIQLKNDSYTASTLSSTAPLIYSYGELSILKNCHLLNNYNGTSDNTTTTTGAYHGMGGAIHSLVKNNGDTVSLTLKDCTIQNCYSGKNGGAVWAKGLYTPSEITGVAGTYTRINFVMDNAEIVDNTCATNGGGLFLATIDGEIKNNSYVRSNTAGNSTVTNKGLGGGIYLSGSNKPESSILIISSDSYVTENTACLYGGGIYQNTDTTLTVANPEESLKNNSLVEATQNGSRLYINAATTSATIYNNETYTSIQKIN